jgi:SecD/SecF fusion protein
VTRPPVLRALLALTILVLSAFFAFDREPNLGLDLRGGTSITLETQDSATTKATAEATDRAVEVLRRRVDALGVSEPTLARSGERRIIVELPGLQDSAEAADRLGETAQLTFHPVLGQGNIADVVGPLPTEPAPLLTADPRQTAVPEPSTTGVPETTGTAPAPTPAATRNRPTTTLPGDAALAAPRDPTGTRADADPRFPPRARRRRPRTARSSSTRPSRRRCWTRTSCPSPSAPPP